MSDYKKYIQRALGISEVKKTEDRELDKAATKEKEEHPQLSKKDARLIAKQHGKENKVNEGSMMNSRMLSPTAIPTPVIGVSVRGSTTGGLPSGADQLGGDISPSRLGGYEKINVNRVNSKLIDNTPNNPDINQTDNPIVANPALQGGVTHTHQVQKNAGDTPQAVTGASTDSDPTLTLKSAAPNNNGINIDVENENKSERPLGMNETFARHKKLMRGILKEKKSTCECGNQECTCKCDESEEKEVKENVGANEPKVNKFKMDTEKAGMVKLSEAFEKMRGLANLGERRVMSSGMWSSPNQLDEINYTTDANGKPTIAVGAPGSNARKEVEKSAKCKSCGKTFIPSYGEYNRCRDCLSTQHSNAETATGVQEGEKWMQDVSKNSEKKGTKGALHKDLGVPEEKKIPTEKLKSLKATLTNKENKTEKELKLLRRIVAALNMRGEG